MSQINLKGEMAVFYSTVKDGNMSCKYGDDDDVKNNKLDFFKKNNLKPEHCYMLDVQYSDIIYDIKDFPKEQMLACDAVISVLSGAYFYLGFGDCIPFFVFDKRQKIMCFAHLGWQSICKSLHTKVITRLLKEYSSNLSDLAIYFGPAISEESYAFPNPAQIEMEEWNEFLQYKNNLYHIDLVGFIVKNILEIGILLDNITFSGIDTASDENFFSHFRSTRNPKFVEGRFIVGGVINEHI